MCASGRALVTGGAGFLGRHLSAALAALGHEVTVLDDLSCPNANFNAPELLHPAISTLQGTILDRELMASLVREHELIVHFACLVGVEETIANPILTVRNLEGTLALCEALTPEHTVLFGSSADVYGAHSLHYDRAMREDDLHIYEDSSVRRWVYPMVKALEENLLATARARLALVRIFNTFGPGMDYPRAKRVVPRFMQCVLEGQPVMVTGDGSQTRTLCYYEDTVRGLLLALEHARRQTAPFHQTVNIGGVETFTILELARTLIQLGLEMGLLRKPLPIQTHAEIYSQAFYDGWNRVPDITRAGTVLGYRPRMPVIDGLRTTLEYYARHPRHAATTTRKRASSAGITTSTDVLIAGAGVAGLACRAALAGHRKAVLVDRDDRPGGLVKVYRRGNFLFDTVVHVLTLRDPDVRRTILQFLPRGVRSFDRTSLVWQRGNTSNYPYQFHAGQLPADIREECLREFHHGTIGPDNAMRTFRDWLLAQFGSGFYRHFFEEYNRKLYGVDPEQLEAGPMVWTIPADNAAAVLRGAEATPQTPRPAVPSFYPRGPRGIAELAFGLESAGEGILRYRAEITSIDWRRHRCRLGDGSQVAYEVLVSSLPLPTLMGLLMQPPAEIAQVASKLEAAPVTVVHLGVDYTTGVLDAHWSYFPDPEIPFYRMTRFESIAPELCPPGSSALMLECPGHLTPDACEVLESLTRIGVLRTPKVDVYGVVRIPQAYVRFRPGHRASVERIHAFLRNAGIHPIGRYGLWQYLNIEQSVQSGIAAAGLLTPQAKGGTAWLPQLTPAG